MDKKGKMYLDSHCSIRFYKYNEENRQSTKGEGNTYLFPLIFRTQGSYYDPHFL